MESYLVNVSDAVQLAEVEQAYWDLYAIDLLCAPGFTAPSMAEIRSGKFSPIICKENELVVGVMVVKNQTNGIYYPAMKGDYVAILESMCLCARQEFGYLTAQTDNQLIHQVAEQLDTPGVTREGNTQRWE